MQLAAAVGRRDRVQAVQRRGRSAALQRFLLCLLACSTALLLPDSFQHVSPTHPPTHPFCFSSNFSYVRAVLGPIVDALSAVLHNDSQAWLSLQVGEGGGTWFWLPQVLCAGAAATEAAAAASIGLLTMTSWLWLPTCTPAPGCWAGRDGGHRVSVPPVLGGSGGHGKINLTMVRLMAVLR